MLLLGLENVGGAGAGAGAGIGGKTIGMATYVKPLTPTGSKEFLVMQKQKEEPLGIERLHGGEIVRVELQELGKGHMGINEGSANKNVNAGILEESGFTGLVRLELV
ncbi:hypothetical protein O6P43_017157 [Quillaja saponaria]|uniref:Uncharacterized protein n=1 Tax=Quillaja saponaria TaxID=32244 RepID=A0AAD7PNA9_QUISA|nr:hypothetical protein O6P43_017157 [Quillaja saponaria]